MKSGIEKNRKNFVKKLLALRYAQWYYQSANKIKSISYQE